MMPSGNSFGKLFLRAKYAVMTRSKQSLGRLLRGTMGEIKADLIIAGGKFIDVYSGEILDGVEMAILDGRICYVGPNARHTNGSATRSSMPRTLTSPLVSSTATRISAIARGPMKTSSRSFLMARLLSWHPVANRRPFLGTAAYFRKNRISRRWHFFVASVARDGGRAEKNSNTVARKWAHLSISPSPL